MKDIYIMAEAIANERGLGEEEVFTILENSHAEIVVKKNGGGDYISTINKDTGAWEVTRRWLVVENGVAEVSEGVHFDELVHLDEEDSEGLEIGEYKVQRIEVEFGRVENNNLKQRIYANLRKLVDAKKEKEFTGMIGEVVFGKVKSVRKGVLIVSVNNHDCLLPINKGGMGYKTGETLRVEIGSVELSNRGLKVILDRSGAELVKELFAMEVPEIHDGSIKIMSIARVCGVKTKLVVKSIDERVDCIGACVGMRGIRIKTISQELNNEGIDIVEWAEDESEMIQNLFEGCEFVSITIDEEDDLIEVVLTDETVGLGIGRVGSTVRLASTILGKKVKVVSQSDYDKEVNAEVEASKKFIEGILDIDSKYIDLLAVSLVKDVNQLVGLDLLEWGIAEDEIEVIEDAIMDAQLISAIKDNDVVDGWIVQLSIEEADAVLMMENDISSMTEIADLSGSELEEIINKDIEWCNKVIMNARKECGWI
jgi:N utilization substance protein A